MADRFFCSEPPVGDQIILQGEEARHLSRVRRLSVGDQVEVFDGKGFAALAEVDEVLRDRVNLRVLERLQANLRQASCNLTLATAVPKGDRFDWLVEKATELGVSRLQPIITERSVVDPREAKLDRLKRVVVEASKQCGRSILMEIARPISWTQFVGQTADSVRLIAHPGGARPSAWPALPLDGAVTLAIGPEGGFTDAEVDQARAERWYPVSLGSTILRIETAGIAGAAVVFSRAE